MFLMTLYGWWSVYASVAVVLAHDATNHDKLSRLQFERQKKEREYKKKQEALTLEETKEQIAQVTWLHQM